MKARYRICRNGELLIREFNGNTLILNDSYWLAKEISDEKDLLYGVPEDCREVEIPEKFFREFYQLIDKHNKLPYSGWEKEMEKIVEEGKKLERKLIKWMLFKKVDLGRYLEVKNLVQDKTDKCTE